MIKSSKNLTQNPQKKQSGIRNLVKYKLAANLDYNTKVEDSDDDIEIPSENVKISNVYYSNSTTSSRTLTLNNSVRHIPITTPRSKAFTKRSQKTEIDIQSFNSNSSQNTINNNSEKSIELKISKVKTLIRSAFSSTNVTNSKYITKPQESHSNLILIQEIPHLEK